MTHLLAIDAPRFGPFDMDIDGCNSNLLHYPVSQFPDFKLHDMLSLPGEGPFVVG